jgi:hypothetical protein
MEIVVCDEVTISSVEITVFLCFGIIYLRGKLLAKAT